MKLNPRVSSNHKSQKAHITSLPSVHGILMSATLSIDLRSKYNVRSILVSKDDEVQVGNETYKQIRPNGRVRRATTKLPASAVKRRWPRCTGASGLPTVNVGINPSKVVIRKLRLNKDRQSLLDHC